MRTNKMRRQVLSKHEEQFNYYDHDILGYMVGGELVTDKPDAETRKQFAGDWSSITQADVWDMVHNSDSMTPVTLWRNDKQFVSYYPKPNDEGTWVVVECKIIDK